MVSAERTPEYLTQFGVAMTQTSPADLDIDVFIEFLAEEPTKRVDFLCKFETTGFLYMSEHNGFVAASMVSKPRICDYQKIVNIAQQGNTLALGPAPILFQVTDLQSTVLVPLNKVDADALKLVYDPLPLTHVNSPLPPELVDDTDSFFTKPKVLTTLPAILVVCHRGLLPEDLWDNLMKALVTTEKENSVTGEKEQKGIVSAYATLRANGYQTCLWTPEVKLGVKRRSPFKGLPRQEDG